MTRVHEERPFSDRSLHPLQKRTLLHWWINSSWRQNSYSAGSSQHMLENFTAHLGITGTRRRAAECIYWPNMSNDIKDFISQCETWRWQMPKCHSLPMTSQTDPGLRLVLTCWRSSTSTTSFLLITSPITSRLMICETHLSKPSSRKMKYHFAWYGLPDIVVSDNGLQFSCQEFFQFANEFDFRHQPSSPGISQANGKAGTVVKTAKTVLKKSIASGKDVYFALLDLRNSPTQGQDTSPVHDSLRRRTRTLLPMTTNLLRQDGIAAKAIDRNLLQRQETQKRYILRQKYKIADASRGRRYR